MSAPLLQTKLHIPHPRPGYVPRPRLLEKLDAAVTARMTLVAAPAGYGKTTLVATWLRQQHDRPTAWLSLDPDNNDPSRFLRYLTAAALPDVVPDLPPMLSGPQSTDPTLLFEALLNELSRRTQGLLLVLDDYHTITSQVLHAGLTTLVDYLPDMVHLILTTRHDPPLPLPRWRARGHLHELRSADLRFNHAESAAFLRETMALKLEDRLVDVLESRTEGWVAGLQLAGLSLRGRGDVAEQVDAFGGTHRHITDYLLSEVLECQPAERRRFLLYTSLLDRFTAGLCDHLLERSDSHATLRALEEDNLFLVPLDERRRWYRYHQLFGELLLRLLRQEIDAATEHELHRRAAAWYAEQDMVATAIRHALAAGDYLEAARLVATLPLYTFWQGTADLSLRHAVDQIPESALRAYPYAAIVAGGIHLLSGDRARLDDFMALVADEPEVRGERALLQAILTRNEGNHRSALALAREAAQQLPGRDPMLEAMAHAQIAVNLEALGQTTAARQSLEALRDRRRPLSAQGIHIDLQATWLLALLNRSQARFQQAETLAREGLQQLEARGEMATPTAGLLLAALGDIHYQWNEVAEAERFFQRAMVISDRTPITDIIISARMGLMDVACARGDAEEARRHIDHLQRLVRLTRFEELAARAAALVARYDLRLGALPRALRWADGSGLSAADDLTYQEIDLYFSLALVRTAEARRLDEPGLLPALENLIRQIVALTAASEHWLFHLRAQLLLAQVVQLRGGDAAPLMRQAVAAGQPAGIMRAFLDFGDPIRPLLQQVRDTGEGSGYVRRLLLALDEEALPAGFDPLTHRETEILHLLAADLTNRQIGQELVVTENTVRTHLKNLYSKLDVHNRRAAVERARSLGLLK